MNPKQLSLKNVMHNLHIIETTDGYELHNAAGTAKYDLWGVRHEVNGIPEYFPTTISLRERAPAPKEKSYSSGISMAIEAGDASKAIELTDEQIRNSEAFINDAAIASGAIHAAAIETPQSVTNIYNISLGVPKDKPVQNKVTFTADQFEIYSGIDDNLKSLLENALKNAAKDVAKKVADDQKAMDCLTSFIRKAIRNECQPGGAIWGKFGRR